MVMIQVFRKEKVGVTLPQNHRHQQLLASSFPAPTELPVPLLPFDFETISSVTDTWTDRERWEINVKNKQRRHNCRHAIVKGGWETHLNPLHIQSILQWKLKSHFLVRILLTTLEQLSHATPKHHFYALVSQQGRFTVTISLSYLFKFVHNFVGESCPLPFLWGQWNAQGI